VGVVSPRGAAEVGSGWDVRKCVGPRGEGCVVGGGGGGRGTPPRPASKTLKPPRLRELRAAHLGCVWGGVHVFGGVRSEGAVVGPRVEAKAAGGRSGGGARTGTARVCERGCHLPKMVER
jgi:hypothetical protein